MHKVLKVIFAFLLLMPFPGLAQVVSPTANRPYYLIHSSGNVLTAGDNAKTVIQQPVGQKVVFIPDGTGSFWVKPAGQNAFMALTDSWNTYFIADSTTSASRYAIEVVGNAIVRLKCKSNGKYLGTDNTLSGSPVYSDKAGNDARHYWYIAESVVDFPTVTERYLVNPAATFANAFDGWGVSLCWWANVCGSWSDAKINELVDWLVSPNGLNYRLFRYNIGGGDDPLNRHCTLHHMGSGKGLRAEMEGFKDSLNAPYNWSRDAAQRKIMLKIKEKRPDAVFEAFSNSAPYYMTYSGCCAGNVKATDDNLNPAYYTDFAQYLVDVCTFYKDSFGIEFKTLEPFNEPVTSYWAANGGQEGCHFSTTAQINFLKNLQPILKASGLQTVISASDETSTDQSVTDFKAYAKDAAVLNAIAQWNAHTYSANNYSRVALRALSTAYGKPLWMSEVGSGGTGIAGNLSLAQKLMDDIQYMRPEAWIDWQYVEEGNDQWCFVKGNFSTKTYLKVKNYYVRQQFSKYIQPGSHFLSLSTNQALAALDKDNQSLVLVLLNNTDLKAYHQVDLSLFQSVGAEIKATRTSDTENNASVSDFTVANRMLTLTLAPRSVTTLVLPVTLNPLWSSALSTDMNYLIVARPSNVVLKANAGSVVVDTYQSGDSTLLWRLKDMGNGYSITSLSGKTLTDPGSYYLQTTTTGGLSGQSFGIERIADGYFKILSKSTGLALDLEGGKYTSGTAVGLYAYGTSPDAVNRQWQLLLPPGTDKGIVSGISEKTLADVAPQVVGSKGELLVRLSSEEVRTMTVYNTSGLRVLEQALTGSCRVPLKAGMYLVGFRSAGRLIGRVEKVVVY